MAFQKLIISKRSPRGHPAAYVVRNSGKAKARNLMLHFRPDVVKRLKWSNPQHVDFEFDPKDRLIKLTAKLPNTSLRSVKPVGAGRLHSVSMPYRDMVAKLFPRKLNITALEIVEESNEHITLRIPEGEDDPA